MKKEDWIAIRLAVLAVCDSPAVGQLDEPVANAHARRDGRRCRLRVLGIDVWCLFILVWHERLRRHRILDRVNQYLAVSELCDACSPEALMQRHAAIESPTRFLRCERGLRAAADRFLQRQQPDSLEQLSTCRQCLSANVFRGASVPPLSNRRPPARRSTPS